MSIRTVYDLSAEERQKHEADWGGYNDFPKGWREINVKTFAQSAYFIYGPQLVEYRQMFDRDNRKPAVGAHLKFMHDNTGFALVNDFWKGTVSFYKFGCEHEIVGGGEEAKKRGVRLYSHDNAVYCLKCGYFAVHDSSD